MAINVLQITGGTNVLVIGGKQGPSGATGPQGPPGPGGGASSPPFRLNKNSSSLQISSSMIGATIYLDTSLGAFPSAILLPASPQDGTDSYRFKDPNGNWATQSVQIHDPSGHLIEDPIANGTWSSSTVTLTIKGAVITLEYDATNTRWVTR